MNVKVRVRLNRVTGEVELFEVEDEKTARLPENEHNREHDRITAEVGSVIERRPHVIEFTPGMAEMEPEPLAPNKKPDEIETPGEEEKAHAPREKQTQ